MTAAAGLAAMFASDDAAKYLEPKTLWLLKNIFIIIGGVLLGLKQFRSTSYADYKNKTKWVENTSDQPPSMTMRNEPDLAPGQSIVKIDTTTKVQTTESKTPTP